jgi:hypothetical protein
MANNSQRIFPPPYENLGFNGSGTTRRSLSDVGTVVGVWYVSELDATYSSLILFSLHASITFIMPFTAISRINSGMV